ncbi:hypothetical protein OVA24_05630 [Luteolibacter sp. SL250]|uniref:hypothetical protein n=1 Tax=Luteolibacter sp. SL250 TaxID=2995170 RepID=UPI002271895A|nr:hypothetical protein [Luteolibacter sp. SL250]WAC20863.1 hypothetical protein OVA24_05630 [Luteolibacter sp. SL250]
MKHSRFRIFLFILLGVSALFAAAAFILPYEWGPDPKARFKIAAVQAKRDRSYYWITVHLKKGGAENHDLMKPVRLQLGTLKSLEPADVTFQGNAESGFTEMWYKFWVSESEAANPLHLKINDGVLTVKTTEGMPPIHDGMMRTFSNPRW